MLWCACVFMYMYIRTCMSSFFSISFSSALYKVLHINDFSCIFIRMQGFFQKGWEGANAPLGLGLPPPYTCTI